MSFVSLVHRHVWGWFPRTLRREALFTATRLIAPRPAQNPPAIGPIYVAGALRTASGLGEAARLSYNALQDSGLDVRGVDLTSALMQRSDADFSFKDGAGEKGPGVVLLHVNAPVTPMAMAKLGRRFVAGKRIIGYWAWELPVAPRDWRHGLPFVNDVWALSSFTAEALRPLVGYLPPVLYIPCALDAAGYTPRKRQKDDPFSVLMIFNVASSVARKNPFAAIRAFKLAFGEDARTRLIVKLANAEASPGFMTLLAREIDGSANVEVIDKVMTAMDIANLYTSCDALISLHRAEGFGLPMAEAMARGIAVVGTDWSGSADFLNERTGIPIPYTLVPAQDPQATYDQPDICWAEADVPEAARALVRLRNNPDLARVLGQNAASYAQAHWTANAYAARMRDLLERAGT